jgi:group I intron endonuclease
MQVYRIFNKKNGKSYIGSTIWTFNERYPGGRWWKWTHSNHLKKAVEKYGLESFEVQILNNSIKNQKELIDIENLYIKQYNSLIPNGYNLIEASILNEDRLRKSYELIDAFGNLYKINNLKDFCDKRKLNYSAICNVICGINASSQGFALPETEIEDIYKKQLDGYYLININTQEKVHIKFNGLKKWCKENNIKYANLRTVIERKKFQHEGWRLQEDVFVEKNGQKELLTEYKSTKYKIELINPEGKIIEVKNIYKFCKDNNFNKSSFYQLIKKESFSAYGYKLKLNDKERGELEKRQKEKGLESIQVKKISTLGIINIKNVSNFCRENNIHLNNFYSMLKGRIDACDGYCLPQTDVAKIVYPKKIIYIRLKSPTGEIIEGDNLKKILIGQSVSSSTILSFISGKCPSSKGWTVLRVKYYRDYYPEINNE